jgi:hypothetical protein
MIATCGGACGSSRQVVWASPWPLRRPGRPGSMLAHISTVPESAGRESAVPRDRGHRGRAAECEPPFSYTATFTLSAGLTFVKISQTYNAARCAETGLWVTCSGKVIGGDIYADSFSLDLRAARAGTYTLKNVVKVTDQSDIDPSNNTADLTVAVGEASVSAAGSRVAPLRSGRSAWCAPPRWAGTHWPGSRCGSRTGLAASGRCRRPRKASAWPDRSPPQQVGRSLLVALPRRLPERVHAMPAS